MYTHFKPYEEGVENFLAVATQAELLLAVFFALLGMLRGVEMERGDDANMIGAILSVGVVVITVLGLIIIVVAICKANPHEPWVRWVGHVGSGFHSLPTRARSVGHFAIVLYHL